MRKILLFLAFFSIVVLLLVGMIGNGRASSLAYAHPGTLAPTPSTFYEQLPPESGGGGEAMGPGGGAIGGPGGGGGGGPADTTNGSPALFPVVETTPLGNSEVPPGQPMVQYTQVGNTAYTYNPTDGNMLAQTTNADGSTSTRSVDPTSQEYRNVEANLQGDEDPSDEILAPTSTAGITQNTTDLYRMGNATSPKVDNVRPGKDVFPDGNGIVQPGKGGISTSDSISRPAKWWKLPANTTLPDGLQFRNDKGGHWLIEPSRPMSLDQFKQLLQQIAGWQLVP